jgi:hypothetical protein
VVSGVVVGRRVDRDDTGGVATMGAAPVFWKDALDSPT